MGTRGAFGFRIDGEDKVTYNHFDSYPSGLGEKILKGIAGRSLESMRRTARQIVLVNDDTPPTQEQINASAKWTNLGVSAQKVEDWYCLLREAQGDIGAWLKGKKPLRIMYDGADFLVNSLFCEYAYIVNLDEGVVEFYRGFSHKPVRGRYGKLEWKPEHRKDKPTEYWGVRLVSKTKLEDIVTPEQRKAVLKKWDRAGHLEDRKPKVLTQAVSVNR